MDRLERSLSKRLDATAKPLAGGAPGSYRSHDRQGVVSSRNARSRGHRRFILAAVLAIASSFASVAAGAEPERRAVAYLARETPRWYAGNHCFSCHNNGDGARALFLAVGPDIRPGSTLGPFENVNVYPLLANILGLNAPQVDGTLNVLSKILKNQPEDDNP